MRTPKRYFYCLPKEFLIDRLGHALNTGQLFLLSTLKSHNRIKSSYVLLSLICTFISFLLAGLLYSEHKLSHQKSI